MVFEVFRSRQKELLVALTLLAMFAFVFAGLFDRIMSQENEGTDPSLATAWGEEITGRQVGLMQRDRNVANQFVTRAQTRVGMPPRPMFDSSDAGVIQGITILKKAEMMGIVVDDTMITEFINAITANRLSQGDFNAVITGAGGESGESPLAISERELYRIIGRELMINRAIMVLTPPTLLDSPYEIWAGRESTLTKVKLQVAKIPVEKFADQVGDPKPEQLQKVYDEFKDQTPNPEAGVIGFRTPHRVEAQYMVANIDNFLGKVSVTPEEIRKYYDENPDEFRPSDAAVPPPPVTPPTAEETPVPPPPTEEKKEDEKASPEGEPKAEEKPVEEKPAEAKPEEKPAEEKPATPPEAEQKPGEAKAPEENSGEEKAAPPQSSSQPGLRSLLASVSAISSNLLTQEEKAEPPPATEPPPAEKPAEPMPPAAEESAEPAPPPPATAPAESKDAPPTPPAAAPPDAETKPAEAPAADTKAADVPATETKAEPPPAPPRPFEEVKADIEKKLLRQKASDLIVGNMQKIVNEVLNPYLDKYLEARNAFDDAGLSKQGKQFEAPPLPDLAKIAAEYGFELKSTGIIDSEQAAEIPGLGTATRPQRGPETEIPFSIAIFDQKLFRSRVVKSIDDTQAFLYWKTMDQPSRVPPLEEVKDQVIAAWRLQEAGPKAKEAAEKLAEAARVEGANLENLAKEAGFTVAETAEFERYISQPNPMFGQERRFPPVVPEIPDAGQELLDEVFKMKVGEVKALADATKRNFYVIKVLSRKEPDFAQFVQHYSLEVGILRDPSFLNQRQEFQLQQRLTIIGIIEESGLKLTKVGEADVDQDG